MDAGTIYLVQSRGRSTQALEYYAAHDFLQTCYPYVKKFGILKALVNTYDKLTRLVRNNKL